MVDSYIINLLSRAPPTWSLFIYMVIQQTQLDVTGKTVQLGEQIGNTPLIHLKNLSTKNGVQLWAKVEWEQLSGSVKARAAYRIIINALETGRLRDNMILLDATSGNT